MLGQNSNDIMHIFLCYQAYCVNRFSCKIFYNFEKLPFFLCLIWVSQISILNQPRLDLSFFTVASRCFVDSILIRRAIHMDDTVIIRDERHTELLKKTVIFVLVKVCIAICHNTSAPFAGQTVILFLIMLALRF